MLETNNLRKINHYDTISSFDFSNLKIQKYNVKKHRKGNMLEMIKKNWEKTITTITNNMKYHNDRHTLEPRLELDYFIKATDCVFNTSRVCHVWCNF